MAEANIRHYEPRCAHGSWLSARMHALVAARLGYADAALRHLRQAAAADLEFDPNSRRYTDRRAGRCRQAVVLGFAGPDLVGEAISLNPRLPAAWRSMSFTVRWRGRAVQASPVRRCASRCPTAKSWTSASPAEHIACRQELRWRCASCLPRPLRLSGRKRQLRDVPQELYVETATLSPKLHCKLPENQVF